MLMEMNVIRRDLGEITLAAGMIDDTSVDPAVGRCRPGEQREVSFSAAGMAILYVVVILVVAFTIGRRFVRWSQPTKLPLRHKIRD